jgi:pimeloyl-ACP methyl ester carboxylesterase
MRTISLALPGACAAPRLSPEQMRSTPPKRLALAVPEPRSTVSVLGVELALHDSDPSGAKPAIFCLHAIGHGGSDFARFERAFADRYRVISVDWPGQGASGPDTKPASALRYAELFGQLVQQLGTKSIVVLGNSIGGAVAIRYAAAHPENTRALVLTDSAGLDSNPGGFLPSLVIGHYQSKFEAGARGDAHFKPWFRDWYASVLITPEARAQRDAIVESAYEIAPVLVQAWASFKTGESDVRALAKGLRMPVLVAWAEHDEVIQWSRNRAAVQQIQHAKVQLFDAGHAAFLEQPAAFNAAAEAFLASL